MSNILAVARGHNGSTTLLVDGEVVFTLRKSVYLALSMMDLP